jgi:hypothetical protein
MNWKALQRGLSVLILIIVAIGSFILLQSREITPGNLWDTVSQTSYERPVYSYQHALTTLWNSHKRDYIEDGTNRLVEVDNQSVTTSLGVSQMLSEAVYEDDKEAFDSMLEWGVPNLVVDVDEEFAFVSEWGGNAQGEWTITDSSITLRDNAFILQALTFAKYRWATPEYDEYIYSMAEYIWGNHVRQFNGRNLVYSYQIDEDTVGLRVSDLTPQVYMAIAPIDTYRDWASLVEYSLEYGARAVDSIEFSDYEDIQDLRYVYEFDKEYFELERFETSDDTETIVSDLAWYQWSLVQYHAWFEDENVRYVDAIQDKLLEVYENELFWEQSRELRLQILMALISGKGVAKDINHDEIYQEHFEPLYNTGDRTWFDKEMNFPEKQVAWMAMSIYHGQAINLADSELYER